MHDDARHGAPFLRPLSADALTGPAGAGMVARVGTAVLKGEATRAEAGAPARAISHTGMPEQAGADTPTDTAVNAAMPDRESPQQQRRRARRYADESWRQTNASRDPLLIELPDGGVTLAWRQAETAQARCEEAGAPDVRQLFLAGMDAPVSETGAKRPPSQSVAELPVQGQPAPGQQASAVSTSTASSMSWLESQAVEQPRQARKPFQAATGAQVSGAGWGESQAVAERPGQARQPSAWKAPSQRAVAGWPESQTIAEWPTQERQPSQMEPRQHLPPQSPAQPQPVAPNHQAISARAGQWAVPTPRQPPQGAPPFAIPRWRPPLYPENATTQALDSGKQGGKRGKRKVPPKPPSPEDVIAARRDRIEQKRTIRAFFVKLAVICLCGWALFTQAFGFASMKGEDMYPRIRDGDLMLYYRLEDIFAIGDVVTFTRNGTRYTGRVVAKEGDKVEIDEAGQLWVNDNIQSEEIFYPTNPVEGGGVPYPLSVPEQSLFLLCDMRTNATDSRVYGAVRLDELDGKVMTVLRRRGI